MQFKIGDTVERVSLPGAAGMVWDIRIDTARPQYRLLWPDNRRSEWIPEYNLKLAGE